MTSAGHIITALEARPYRVPVELPLGRSSTIEMVVVSATTADGHVGTGVAGPGQGRALTALVEDTFAGRVVGQPCEPIERLVDDIAAATNSKGLGGAWSSAMAAVDVALWDLAGRRSGRSIAQLLGGCHDRVRGYVTFGFGSYTAEELAEVATTLCAAGHRSLKMVVGRFAEPACSGWTRRAVVREDAERIAAVRQAVGDGVELMIDANCLMTRAEATSLARAVEPLDIAWFEEPVLVNDPEDLRAVRSATSIPVAAGQRLAHLWDHRRLIDHGSIDIAQPNVCHTGGYTEGRRVAYLARAHHLDIANGGGWPHFNLHLQAGLSNGSRVELHLPTWRATEAMFEGHAQVDGGWIELPTAPGHGLRLREEAEQWAL